MQIRFSPESVRHSLTPVHNRFILDYLPHADGTAVRVYLYGLMQCCFSSTAEQTISDALGLSDLAVLESFLYWQKQGLVRISCQNPLIVEYLPIEGESVVSAVTGNYTELVTALNALTAPRQFDVRELKHVYDWVEVYQLDEAAVLELVAHCMDLKGRRVSVNYISTVAQSWSEKGIRTREQALACIEDFNLKKHGASAILLEWNKHRKPTRTEMDLYEKWTRDWGFDHSAIMAALPRISLAGSPSFAYLDDLLDHLRSEKITSSEQIMKQDNASAGEKAFAKLLFDRAGKTELATPTQRAQIRMYLEDWHMPRELLLYGAEQCRGANEPFGLMKKKWNEWHEAGVDTLQKAEEFERTQAERRHPKSYGAGRSRSIGYDQHSISDSELDHLLINFDEE